MLGAIGVSAVVHAAIVAFVVLGLPIFWDPEPLPAVIGIELAQQADITASNARVQGPPKPTPEKPKPVETKTEAPKKETPAPLAAPKPAAVPPPEPEPEEEVAAVIPDPQAEKKLEDEKKKKEEEKKKAEEEKKRKKKEEEEKKRKEAAKKEEEDFNKMMGNLIPDAPAPEPEQKPDKKSKPAPAEQETGEVTENYSPVPLNAGEEDGIRRAIERRWNVPLGLPNVHTYVVSIRLHMNRDGTVSRVEVISSANDATARAIAESAKRAVNIAIQQDGRLPVPADKYNSTIQLRWNMELVCAQMGC